MPPATRPLLLAALLSVLSMGGFAQQPPASAMPNMPAVGAHPPRGSAEDSMMSAMQKMQQAMATTPMTGDVDRDFVAMMIPHHAGAIDMAKTELQHGKDPAMRALARRIIADQEKEIAQMKEWQRTHAP